MKRHLTNRTKSMASVILNEHCSFPKPNTLSQEWRDSVTHEAFSQSMFVYRHTCADVTVRLHIQRQVSQRRRAVFLCVKKQQIQLRPP